MDSTDSEGSSDKKLKGSVSRVYADVLNKKESCFWDYENFTPIWGDPSHYDVIKKVGKGKYSEVFEGINRLNGRKCIIKVLKPVKSKKIKREIQILMNLCNCPNIIKLYDVVKHGQSNTPALVMELVNATDHKQLYPSLSLAEIKYYMYELLVALDYSHANGVFHRDIKPQKFVIEL